MLLVTQKTTQGTLYYYGVIQCVPKWTPHRAKAMQFSSKILAENVARNLKATVSDSAPQGNLFQ